MVNQRNRCAEKPYGKPLQCKPGKKYVKKLEERGPTWQEVMFIKATSH